jgi:hypothetical protein
MLQGRIPRMTALEPQSTAAALALCLIAALATAVPAQLQPPQRKGHENATSVSAREPAAVELHHYGILGAVGSPGVYICVHDDLTLAELVSAAGGATPQAAGSAQVIRRGHTGPRLNCSPPSTAALAPGDVVVLEHAAAGAIEQPSSMVGVGLVGLTKAMPVVVQVPPPLTELPQLLGALHQEPALIDSVRILRTASRQFQTSGDQPPGRLIAGDIVVFNPADVDHAALAQAQAFPPPVLIPQRERVEQQRMIIQPYRPDVWVDETVTAETSIGEAVPVAATTAQEVPAKTGDLPEDVWPLMHEPAASIASNSAPPLALPETVSQPIDAGPEAPSAVAPTFPGPEADRIPADQICRETQPIVATALTGAMDRPSATGSLAHARQSREPQRMAALPHDGTLAMASEVGGPRATAAKYVRTASSSGRLQQAAAANSSTFNPARGFGRRAISVGIFVLATALFCFVASLLWSRLDDSTGLTRASNGATDAALPLHAHAVHRTALDRLINNALPIIEEPTPLPERSNYFGEAVGRQRLRIDADQTLTGPHFAAAQQISQPVAVPASAGTVNTRSKREDSPAGAAASDAETSPRRQTVQGGLLDRVLVAMEREKRR